MLAGCETPAERSITQATNKLTNHPRWKPLNSIFPYHVALFRQNGSIMSAAKPYHTIFQSYSEVFQIPLFREIRYFTLKDVSFVLSHDLFCYSSFWLQDLITIRIFNPHEFVHNFLLYPSRVILSLHHVFFL